MPNSNNQDQAINFSASHDQVSILADMASKYKELHRIIPKLENLENPPSNFKKLLPEELQQLSEELKKQYNELDETKKEISNLVKYARQIVSDLQECAKKFSAIHPHTPNEKLKHATLLLANNKPLTANEKYRFKEIEDALSNTCIIKSAGDETVKFQLGILGYARDSNKITESEFNYLVVPRLKDNNLLDSYRLRVEKDMILKRTPLEICQALDKDLSNDDDYAASKNLFEHRLNGINYELSLHNCNSQSPRDVAQLKQELEMLAQDSTHASIQNFENLPYPEAPTDSFELNSEQPSNERPININHTEEYKEKSEFVSIMEKLIPEKKKNVILIDTVQPISLETIMQASLERSSLQSENEIFKLNYKTINKIHEASTLALHKIQEQFTKSYSTDGSDIYKEMMRSGDASNKDRAENLKKTEPCKLTGEKLVNEYYRFGKGYLEDKIKKIEEQKNTLEYNKKNKFAEFDKSRQQYRDLNTHEIRNKREQIYITQKKKLDTELEVLKKQQALWLGKKTFTRCVEKNGKIKQEEIPFPEKELQSRDYVLNFNPNLASEGKTSNVYQDGVYLVSNKKAESSNIPQISSRRAPYKNCISGLTAPSSNLYNISNKKQENHKQAVGMTLKS
jgi:hypothetical protein